MSLGCDCSTAMMENNDMLHSLRVSRHVFGNLSEPQQRTNDEGSMEKLIQLHSNNYKVFIKVQLSPEYQGT